MHGGRARQRARHHRGVPVVLGAAQHGLGQRPTDAAALPCVLHEQGELGCLAGDLGQVREPDHLGAVLGHHRQVQLEQPLLQRGRELRHRGEVAAEDRVERAATVHARHGRAVCGRAAPQREGGAVPQR